MPKIPNLEHDAFRVNDASVFYQIEAPLLNAFFQLGSVVPAFVKKSSRFPGQPRGHETEQDWQRRESPRGDYFWDIHRPIHIFYAVGIYACRRFELTQRTLEECGLLAVTLYKVDAGAISLHEENRNDAPGKSTAGSEIQPAFFNGCKLHELRAIQDMTAPRLLERGRRRQIYSFRPPQEAAFELQKAFECFT